jgi:formate dehydrogenase maturation protein FdhE
MVILFILIVIALFLLWAINDAVKDMEKEDTVTCECYCPYCRNALVSNNCFLSEDQDGVISFRCNLCRKYSLWLFDAPVPILLKEGSDEKNNIKETVE